MFSKTLYTGHVTEGLTKESPVIGGDGAPLVIQATDADVNSGGLLYELIGSSAFVVDSHSGVLTTNEVGLFYRGFLHFCFCFSNFISTMEVDH